MSVTAPVRSAERRVLDEAGGARAMTGVMAIMMFLSLLALAGGLAVREARTSLARETAGRMTVALPAGDPRGPAVLAALRATPRVAAVRPVAPAEIGRLLRPWLGEDAVEAGLPVPVMIDIDLADAAPATADAVAARVRAAAPGARVDRHEGWMNPVARLMDTAAALAAGLVVLMLGAVAAVVALAARAGLETHRGTVEVMHMLGATDRQVARLFQRRIALDAAAGGAAGALAAAGVLFLVARELGALGSDLLGGGTLVRGDWIALGVAPFVFIGLAVLAARIAVTAALRRAL